MTLSVQSLAEVRFAGRSDVRTRSPLELRRRGSRSLVPDAECLPETERRLVAEVFCRTGLAMEDYRSRPLRRRIAAALRCARRSDLSASVEALHTDSALADKLLNTLLIGYTTAFRDEPVFERLRNQVLPEMLAERRALRIWSAGCSHGLELYSAALLLGERGRLEDCELRGTDMRKKAVADAPHFGPTFWDSLPEAFADLKKIDRQQFLRQTQRIDWQVEDVFSCRETDRYDLIFCRNLAIYLKHSAAGKLWEKLARALVPAGVLVTGKAEKPFPSGMWQRIEPCIYRVVKP